MTEFQNGSGDAASSDVTAKLACALHAADDLKPVMSAISSFLRNRESLPESSPYRLPVTPNNALKLTDTYRWGLIIIAVRSNGPAATPELVEGMKTEHRASTIARILALPNEVHPAILRLVGMAGQAFPKVHARSEKDGDDDAYLGRLVDAPAFLLLALTVPPMPELHGLDQIMIDPSLSRTDRIEKIKALHAQAADLCSYHYFHGRSPDETDRFYVARMERDCPGYVVVDYTTGSRVFDDNSRDVIDRVAQAFNLCPELAEEHQLLRA